MKSNVSDHLEVAQSIYIDACAKCIADVSDLRDLITIKSRVKNEGLSFLTITLPKFSRDFERSLEIGFIDSTCFLNFKKNGSIPALLQGMTSLIFDRETGRIKDVLPSDVSVVVDSVRQICLTFEKQQIECTPKRVQLTLSKYKFIEQSLRSFSVPTEDASEFSNVSSVLWGSMLGDLRFDMLVPRHGPGATAEGISGNQKYSWQYWHERLEQFLPIVENAYSISAFTEGEIEKVTFAMPEQERPVRVVTVPKTLKGPRVIAIEPVCMQYAQQAARSYLYDRIESFWLTRGHVNFRDQNINQNFALTSSKDGRYATIDLSDASDRVPRDLALEMFRSNPDFRDFIDACRSTSAELPDGSIVSPLSKFASMGSALCFPIESMYFYTICVAALLKKRNLPVSHRNVYNVSRDIYVYGDDIIVPVNEANVVLDYLQKYNCKVNKSKTFVEGNFRESCGLDAYEGELVTPIYLRKLVPKHQRQVSELISWTATANLFYLKGYWHTADLLFKSVEKILGPLPYVSPECSGLGRVSLLGYRSVERWNSKLHRFEVKAWTPRPVYRSDRIDGYAALQKSLLRLVGSSSRGSFQRSETPRLLDPQRPEMGFGDASVVDALNLERSELRGAVALQRRWVAPQ